MRFIYHAHDHESEKLGITAPTLDLHGRPLVYPRTVAANDPTAARKIRSGEAFDIDERKEPVLAGFLRADRRFQNVRD